MRIVLGSLLVCISASCTITQSAVTPEDLQHHRWVLQSMNGEPLPALDDGNGSFPELDFGEQMTVSGNLGCNRFNGQAVLRDGGFLVERLVSTRMTCPSPWIDIERTVETALSHRSTISLDAERNLTLETADTTLVFRLQDWVQ
jgi:heat shock protein HslJ